MYDHKKIEQKWQKKWDKESLYKVADASKKSKYYVLDMFPYPSGAGLHVGHPRGYIATDVLDRYKMLNGFNVLHPMGWDAFGLPAENYALANKVHPKVATDKNIINYKRQLNLLGLGYDWSREINTTDPEYYKWTQWAFVQMFNKGLVYESNEPINWCPTCLTGLANEDVEDGKCERCDTPVVKKPMRQWMIRITDYADRLLNDLDKLNDWEEPIKTMQRNWIGRSEGASIKFQITNTKLQKNPKSQIAKNSVIPAEAGIQAGIEVFTTRPDTIFGATYMVVCPEHSLISNFQFPISNRDEVEKYIKKTKNKSDLERTDLNKDKTGVELKGIKAINPATNEAIPIWVADYVLPNYGTGAIMAVPAHDERDFAFASKYELPIKQVVAPIRIDIKNPPQADKSTVARKTVHGLVLNPKTGKILCLKWKQQPWTGFVVGGVDEGEDIIEAAKREIREETGYVNLKFIRVLGGVVRGEYFAAHKNENRLAYTNAILFELENEEQEAINAEEQAKHEPLWLDPKTLNHDNFTCAELDLWFERLAHSEERADNGYGAAINSDFLDGLTTEEAKAKIIDWLAKKKIGAKQIQYKLKDWVFSRQRYWGEPLPLVYCESCKKKVEEYKKENNIGEKFSISNFQPASPAGGFPKNSQEFSLGELINPGWVEDNNLPLKLPEVEHYEPSGTGESPLATISDWVNTKCPKCGGNAKRETNTMPQWAGSSWYYLAYIMKGVIPTQEGSLQGVDKGEAISPSGRNDKRLPRSLRSLAMTDYKEAFDKWLPVDTYVGGAEHATRHLIYARFWHKFLFDIGVVSADEPFAKLRHVGLILAEDGRKMSKRWDNVINPDDIIVSHGADALRIYEMFMGPFGEAIAWNTNGLSGARKFLDRIYNLNSKISTYAKASEDKQNSKFKIQNSGYQNLLQKTIKKVGSDIETFKFNTAVSALMILVNKMTEVEAISREDWRKFLIILAPFAPHLAEELWNEQKGGGFVFNQPWPEFDPKQAKDEVINLVVQINGKLRDTIEVSADISETQAKKLALASEKIIKWLDGKTTEKIICVKGKLVNIVIR